MAGSTEFQVFSTVEWKIPKFFDLPKENSYFLKSPSFYLAGSREKWFLQFFPYASHFGITYVILRLNKEASEINYQVTYRMGIRNIDGSDIQSKEGKIEKFHQTQGDISSLNFVCMRSRLTSANSDSDGMLTIFCTAMAMTEQTLLLSTEATSKIPSSVATEKCFSLMSSSRTIEAASQTSSLEGETVLIENLKDLYLSKRNADIKITVKGREFFAHTHLLTARSKVFCSMFSNDMVEKNSGTVEITDCDPDSFDDFLLFLYTGNFDVVSSSNAVSLYETADKYDSKELKEECVRCMMNEMNLDSFCDVLHLAAMYDETDIVTAATKFFIANAKSILLTTKWANFMADNFTLGNELFLKFVDKHAKNEC